MPCAAVSRSAALVSPTRPAMPWTRCAHAPTARTHVSLTLTQCLPRVTFDRVGRSRRSAARRGRRKGVRACAETRRAKEVVIATGGARFVLGICLTASVGTRKSDGTRDEKAAVERPPFRAAWTPLSRLAVEAAITRAECMRLFKHGITAVPSRNFLGEVV